MCHYIGVFYEANFYVYFQISNISEIIYSKYHLLIIFD